MNSRPAAGDADAMIEDLRAELRESYLKERAAQARVVQLEGELHELRVHGLARSLARASGILDARDAVRSSSALKRARQIASRAKKRVKRRLK